MPMLILEARELTRTLEEHRVRDLDVLDAEAVTAIDDFGWHTDRRCNSSTWVECYCLLPEGRK